MVNTEKEDLVQRSREATGGRGAYTSLDPVAGTFTDTVSCCSLIAQQQPEGACAFLHCCGCRT